MTEEIRERLTRIEGLLLEMKAESRKLLDVPAAAAYLGVYRDFMYRLTSGGRITFYKPNNKKIYFKRQDLDRYCLQNRKSPDQEITAVSGM